jgi:hypothetical protein
MDPILNNWIMQCSDYGEIGSKRFLPFQLYALLIATHNNLHIHRLHLQICRHLLPPADQVIGKLALSMGAGLFLLSKVQEAFAMWGLCGGG